MVSKKCTVFIGPPCTEIAVQEDFVPSNMTSGGTSVRTGGGLKKFSTLAIARHILRPLVNYDMIRPLPKTLPIPHPSRCHWRLDPRRLRCHELGSPTFQTKVMPLAGPQASHQLNPALALGNI